MSVTKEDISKLAQDVKDEYPTMAWDIDDRLVDTFTAPVVDKFNDMLNDKLSIDELVDDLYNFHLIEMEEYFNDDPPCDDFEDLFS